MPLTLASSSVQPMIQGWQKLTHPTNLNHFHSRIAELIFDEYQGIFAMEEEVAEISQEYQVVEIVWGLTTVLSAVAAKKSIPVKKLRPTALINSRVYSFDANKYKVMGDSLIMAIAENFPWETRGQLSYTTVMFINEYLRLLFDLGQDQVMPEPAVKPSRINSIASESASEHSRLSLDDVTAVTSSDFERTATTQTTHSMCSNNTCVSQESKTLSRTSSKKSRRKSVSGGVLRSSSIKHSVNSQISVTHIKESVCEANNDYDEEFDLVNCFDIAPTTTNRTTTTAKQKQTCVIV